MPNPLSRSSLHRLALPASIRLVLALLVAAPAAAAEPGDEPEALIGTSEEIAPRDVGAEHLSKHEEGSEAIDRHEDRAHRLDGMSVPPEELSRHHATSETPDGRSIEAERVFGMGHPVESDSEALARAEQALRDARAAHQAAYREHGPAARAQQPDASSSSLGTGDHSQWMARLHLQQKRVRVAEAQREVMDARYAQMLQRDYPRGQARQQLIDERNRAKARLATERRTTDRLVEQARQAGVPESVLGLASQ